MAEVTSTLDDSQRAVVEVDPENRQVVIAGPGSGKTEVVAALIAHLDANGLDLDEELLVVSFSRAAVRAVRGRLDQDSVPMALECVRTIDSLASRVLSDVVDEDWEHLSFDDRISLATGKVGDWDPVADLAHVIVDEFQDIVGVRAEFLSALFAALDDTAGFTVLGDPAQAIYDFQLTCAAPTDTAGLQQQLVEQFGAETRHLTGQYRARSRDAQRAVRTRDDVLSAGDGLTDFGAELPMIASVGDAAGYLGKWGGRTAFLTATNGAAASVAQDLWRAGVPAHLQPSAAQPLLEPWLASLVGTLRSRTLTRADFGQMACSPRGVPQVDIAWAALREISDRRSQEVDLTRLSGRLSSGFVPHALVQDPSPPVVVSTVHRAKGLEFDNVVMVGLPLRSDADDSSVARVGYVAATRAKERLAHLSDAEHRALQKHKATDRWKLRGHQSWQTFGVEIRHGDIDRTAPFEDSRAVQALLAGDLRIGTPIELTLAPRSSTLQIPVYTASIDGLEVGLTSQTFGSDVATIFGAADKRRRRTVAWPAIQGAHVRAVETVVGDTRPDAEVGRWGLWLSVVPGGIVRPVWQEGKKA